MASLTKKTSTKKTGKISVVVCEYHQDVIQFIHRYIVRKKLPFKGSNNYIIFQNFCFFSYLIILLKDRVVVISLTNK